MACCYCEKIEGKPIKPLIENENEIVVILDRGPIERRKNIAIMKSAVWIDGCLPIETDTYIKFCPMCGAKLVNDP